MTKRLSLIITLIIVSLTVAPGYGADTAGPRVLKVGAYENPPKIFSLTNGKIVGIFPDLLENIAAQEGWQLDYVQGTWVECLERLEKNQINIMVDVAYSDVRSRKYKFSHQSVFINWGTVYTRSGFHVESLLDLRGL